MFQAPRAHLHLVSPPPALSPGAWLSWVHYSLFPTRWWCCPYHVRGLHARAREPGPDSHRCVTLHSPPDGAILPIMAEVCQPGPSSQSYGFSSSHVWTWELDYKESWALNNLCFWTVVLEKTLQSPLDSKEIQPVHPKGNQSWIFIGRTDAEAETPILWPPDGKNWLFGKDPDAGKDWGREEKETREDETVGWHHWLDGHEFKQAPGVGAELPARRCVHRQLGHFFKSALPLIPVQMVVLSLLCQKVTSQEMFSLIPGTCSREGCQLQAIPLIHKFKKHQLNIHYVHLLYA